MRIKSLTPTDRYKHIELQEISDDQDNRFVLTPTGWSKVLAFDFTRKNKSKIVTTNKFTLVCDPEHLFKAVDNSGNHLVIYAKDLDPEIHKLISYDGLVSFSLRDGSEEDFYDIQIESPHWWFTSSFVTHNSILLCNNAMSSYMGPGPGGALGQDVLFITYELDVVKTAMRCIAATTKIPINSLLDHQQMAKRQFSTMSSTYKKKIYFHEWAPEECSVDHIYQLLASLKRTHGWKPDVIVIDYMDLMISRREAYNSDDYNRQKHVATELRGLAKKENVLLFTATQTNRSGMDDALIDLNKKAESFGSNFALDYVISLNQSIDERTQVPAQLRMFIAKNRNGPKHETITCEINYSNMVITEVHNQLTLNVDKSTESVNTTHKRKS
jgi:hypothetical protein